MRHLTLAVLLLVAAGCKGDEPVAPASPAPDANRVADPHAGHEGHGQAGDAPVLPVPPRRVSFVWPQDGSTVFSVVDASFGVEEMKVRPAGEDPLEQTSGHHHVIVDGQPIAKGQVVPKDATHLHYGGGESVTELTLPLGEHNLTLQFADGAHISYGPELSTTIKVKVVEGGEGRRVFFPTLKDGQQVKSPLTIDFGVEGMVVRPAGEDVLDKTSGHHHLIIDGAPDPLGTVVAKDETHIHFGKGETSTTLSLTPGKHTLTLQFADGAHLSYGQRMAATITVDVVP